MKPPLIIITGPTAVGKSALAVQVAKRIGGEVISADSMQVYRGMDIGTAKITPQEMEGIPHHLLDILSPDEPFDVVRFQALAREAFTLVQQRGHIPILAGGTGFYIQAAVYDIDFTESDTDPAYRLELEKTAAEGESGIQRLYQELKRIDPVSAVRIHPHNIKRVIRALEFYHCSGKRISRHNDEQAQRESPFDFSYYVLTDDRAAIYERINRRVDEMIARGLDAEVRVLKDKGYTKDLVSMQGIGYKEMLDYLNGACTLDEAAEQIKLGSRHFAKRQLTWFRRESGVQWIDRRDFGGSTEAIAEYICSRHMQRACGQEHSGFC